MDQKPQAGFTSQFPLPPSHLISKYTDENIARGLAPAPPQVIQGTYSCFGEPHSNTDHQIRPLEVQGFKRLHPLVYDHRKELKKMNISVLINFLDLLDIVTTSPDSEKRAAKLKDMELLFIHLHHFINEYRPHQARETLRVLLQQQAAERSATAQRFLELLKGLADQYLSSSRWYANPLFVEQVLSSAEYDRYVEDLCRDPADNTVVQIPPRVEDAVSSAGRGGPAKRPATGSDDRAAKASCGESRALVSENADELDSLVAQLVENP